MKTLEFIYQETQIHFALQNDGHVMVNATEMAKLFKRRTKDFIKTDHAKAFIEVAERAPNRARSEQKIIDNRGHMGVYFNKRLALKFAAWLSPEFEYWVYSTIDEIVFGNYKKHWEAHQLQIEAEKEIEVLEAKLVIEPTAEMFKEYLLQKQKIKTAKAIKQKAIRNQLKLEL